MDSRGAPERIGGGHSCDQGLDLGVDGRAAHGGPAGERGPVLAEAAPLPTQDGVGGHDHEGLPPPGPDPGQPDPEETISRAKLGPGHRSLVHGELVAQGEVLEGELAVAAAEEREESEQVEQQGDHRTAIVSGSEPKDQPLVRRTGFWRRTGCATRRGGAQVPGSRERWPPTPRARHAGKVQRAIARSIHHARGQRHSSPPRVYVSTECRCIR